MSNTIGDVTLTNSIIAKNSATNRGPDISNFGTLTDGGHNLVGDRFGQTDITDDNNGNIVGVDPLFIMDVPANDSLAGDLRLQLCSPAIDAGINAPVTLAIDLDSMTRIVGGIVDIGAYELQSDNVDPALMAMAGPDHTLCDSSVFSLSANEPATGQIGEWTIISGPGTLTRSDTAATSISGVSQGNQTFLRWTVTNGSCSESDTVVLQNSVLPIRIYVDSSAVSGANNGTSWVDAYTDLQSAINTPRDTCGVDIWVAKGTYYPTSGNGRNISFTISNEDVKIYGGFTGGETQLSARNWVDNPTILSGNIGNLTNTSDNSKLVVLIQNVSEETTLDGLIIQDGNGTNGSGGIRVNQLSNFSRNACTPIINNCIIRNNQGGGVYSLSSIGKKANPYFSNCIVYDNLTASGKLSFAGRNSRGNPQNFIVNCTVLDRVQVRVSIENSIILSSDSLNALNPLNGLQFAYNSIIQGDCISCIAVQDVDPLFVDPTNKNFELQECSPAINGGLNLESVTADFNGDLRPASGRHDMGAYEYQGSLTTTCYRDADGDGYGSEGLDILSCATCQEGYAMQIGDCDDSNAAIHPSATEICNGRDDNCNNQTDEGLSNMIIYVDSAATGANTGTSWTDAYTDLQDAIRLSDCSNNQIWVAKGTYTPSTSRSDQRSAFYWIASKSTEIYGGFLSGDMNIGDRDWKNNTTIISGDIGVKGDSSDNCYSIIRVEADDCKIDGFIIEHNNSLDHAPSFVHGGIGVFTEDWDDELPLVLSITNCEFRDNYSHYGSCITSEPFHGDIEVNISNCSFHDNYSAIAGGVIYNRSAGFSAISSVNITASTFRNNSSGDNGGAIYNQASSGNVAALTIEDCIFENNHCNINGGAINNFSEGTGNTSGIIRTTIRRSIFRHNTANQAGGAIWAGETPAVVELNSGNNTEGAIQISNSLFHNNQADNGGACYAAETYPLIYNSTFTKNSADTEGAVLFLKKSVDLKSPFGGSIDLDGPIFINSILWANGSSPIFFDIGSGSSTLKNKKINRDYITHSIYDDGTPDGRVNIPSLLIIGYGDAIRTKSNGVDASFFSLSDYDPLFIDPDNDDYRLQSCSPAVNTGYDLSNTTIVDINADTLDLTLLPRAYDNGIVDMGAYELQESFMTTCYRDFDQDSYGDPNAAILACPTCPQGYVLDNTDCDDIYEAIYPGATEICNGIDDDCDGEIDEGFITNIVENTDDDGCGSLRYAVRHASAGDTIRFDPSINGDTIMLTRDLTINKQLVIIGNDKDSTLISANYKSSIFRLGSEYTGAIEKLTLTKGLNREGGALMNRGELTLRNVRFEKNIAHQFYSENFNNKESNQKLRSDIFGGAISNEETGNLIVENCQFESNHSLQDAGAIKNGGMMRVENSIFTNNTSPEGGALWLIRKGDILDNIVNSVIRNCIFSNNSSSRKGGAILNHSSTNIVGSLFSGNSSNGKGGAISTEGSRSTLSILSSTIAANQAENGGGIYSESNLEIYNSIIAQNDANIGQDISHSGLLDINASHTLIQDVGGSHGIVHDVNGNITGIDPLFVDATVTVPSSSGDFRLQSCSPAINAGINDSLGVADTLDLDGLDRIQDMVVDIGAYEYQGVQGTVVTNTNDDGCGSLRSAVAYASNGDTITFSPMIDGDTIKLTSGEITLDKNLVIIGNDTSSTIIDGMNNSRIFYIPSEDTVAISAIRIQGGNGEGVQLPFTLNRGGAILNQGHLTLNNSTLSYNKAIDGAGLHNSGGDISINNSTLKGNVAAGNGGALANYGVAKLINSTLNGNSANNAGAIFNVNNNVTLISSELSGNTAIISGGGIYNYSFGTNSTITLINSIVSGNTSDNGGGIYNRRMQSGNAIVTLTNATFSGNVATHEGGAIFNYNRGSKVYLTNSILAKNVDDGSGPDIYRKGGVIKDRGHNVIGDTTSVGSYFTKSTLLGSRIDPLDPLFIMDVPTNDSLGGDLRLQSCSPAINAGINDSLPKDIYDIDGDMDVTELLPYDLSDSIRVVGGIVDIGAYEYQGNTTNNLSTLIIKGPRIVCPNLTNIPYSVRGAHEGMIFDWSFSEADLIIDAAGSSASVHTGASVGGILEVVMLSECADTMGTGQLTIEIGTADFCRLATCERESEYIDNELLSIPRSIDVYKVSKRIESNATIPVERSIVFKAGQAIELHPEFEVPLSATFIAEIESCATPAIKQNDKR